MIPFNKPYLSGYETDYIRQAVATGKISGNGLFTQKCQKFFENRYHIKKALLTTSCTDALEMCALLLDIQQGDEVIMPSFTFVSTANAFVLRGAKIVFADSHSTHPNIDETTIAALITPRTKAIVVVHYAGVACNMDSIMTLAKQYGIFVIEDAAQAVDSYYNGRPLGSIGHLAAFSFHETKNIISGEGGLLAINDAQFLERAEIIWEKGTNRAAFFRGDIDKYGWVDVGSSFLPSEITAAFLYAQLENITVIQQKRLHIWNAYYANLKHLNAQGKVDLPFLPAYASNNGHMFYLICKTVNERDALLTYLKQHDILAVFHYQSLHASKYYKDKHDKRVLFNCDHFSNTLVRLPFYFELEPLVQEHIVDTINMFYGRA